LGLSALPDADQRQESVPIITEFQRDKYRHVPGDGVRRYLLSDVLLMPSRDWVVFVIESNNCDPCLFDANALGSYHVPSGRTRQLTFPPLAKRDQSRILMELLPLGRNQCGVVVAKGTPVTPNHERIPGQQSRGSPAADGQRSPNGYRWERFLWQWDLLTDKASFIGRSDGALGCIARVVRQQQCELAWTSCPGGNLRGELMVRDRSSGNATRALLRLGIGSLHIDGVTFAPTSKPCAFATCDASDINKRRLEVFCIDPNARSGIRWRVTLRDLENIIGGGISGAALLQDVESSARPLAVFAQRTVSNQSSSYLLFLEQETGRIAGHRKLPFHRAYPNLPIISPDQKRVVFLDYHLSVMGKLPATAEDVLDAESRLVIRIIDLDSGKFRDTENLYDTMEVCWLRGFLDHERALISDEHALWVLSTIRGNLQLRELFRLNR